MEKEQSSASEPAAENTEIMRGGFDARPIGCRAVQSTSQIGHDPSLSAIKDWLHPGLEGMFSPPAKNIEQPPT